MLDLLTFSAMPVVHGLAAAAAAATDFDYRHTTSSSSLGLPGKVHAGFARIAEQLWANGLKAAVDTHVVAGSVSTVQFSGHSLGAGVATLLAYTSQVSSAVSKLVVLFRMVVGRAAACWHVQAW
jgi:hypothetical protein